MNQTMIRLLKLLWIGIMVVAALAIGLRQYVPAETHDGNILSTYLMLAVSFPLGLIPASLFSASSYLG